MGDPKPKPTLGKPNPKPQQIYSHENDHSSDNPNPEDSTQEACSPNGYNLNNPPEIESLRGTFVDFQSGKHQLIIPDIISAHFHVINVAVDYESANFILSVEYYDSMNTSVETKNSKSGVSWKVM